MEEESRDVLLYVAGPVKVMVAQATELLNEKLAVIELCLEQHDASTLGKLVEECKALKTKAQQAKNLMSMQVDSGKELLGESVEG